MATQTGRRSRRSDARATHAALLEAAAGIAARAAPDLPYDEIALTAGVGRATVYRHFPTREALAAAIIEDALARWEETVGAIAPGPDQFDQVFQAWVHTEQDRRHPINLLTCAATEEARRQARRRLEESLRPPVALGRALGSIRADITARDVRIAFTMLGAALRCGQPAADRRRAIELARHALAPARGEHDIIHG